MRTRRGVLILVLIATAQYADTNPSFEVATIKPSAPEAATRHFTIQGQQFSTTKTSLADLIQFAYGLHPHQIANGPSWLESQKFDMVGLAKGDAPPTEQEWMKMTANLLAERFHLRYHSEKRELPVFAITVDGNGPMLQPSDASPDALPAIGFRGRGQLIARNANIGDLAWELQSAVLDRPVVDQTGLTKRYNFTLEWTPDDFQTSALVGEGRSDDQTPPHLLAAVREQLGLRLTSTKRQADVMVIEQISAPDPD